MTCVTSIDKGSEGDIMALVTSTGDDSADIYIHQLSTNIYVTYIFV